MWLTVSAYCTQNSVTELTKMELLRSLILNDATSGSIVMKLSKYKQMSDRILLLDGHPGLILLKNVVAFPRLLFTLRTAPCHHHPELLAEYAEVTYSTTEAVCNVHFYDNSWSQAKLPVRQRCLGVRTASDLALLAFQPSCVASDSLLNDIIHQPTNTSEENGEFLAWLDRDLDLLSDSHRQRNWDDMHCSSAVATLVTLIQPASSDHFQGGFAS